MATYPLKPGHFTYAASPFPLRNEHIPFFFFWSFFNSSGKYKVKDLFDSTKVQAKSLPQQT